MPTAGLSPKETVRQEMHKYKHGTLHSGTGKPGGKGKLVTDRQQAIAIALSEAGLSNKPPGGKRRGK